MHIWASLKQAEPELSVRLEELSRRPFDDLARLPDWSSVGKSPEGIEFTLNRKTLSDGRLEIVLQAYRPGRRLLFLKFGQMLARGMWVSEAAPFERMPEDALYDYM